MRSRPASPNARLKPRAGSHRSAWATCRLPTSATECSPNTLSNRPDLDAYCSGKPPRDQVASPLAGFDPPSFLRPGVAPAIRLLDPHRDNRLPRWIYPNLTDSGTPCHEPVPNSALKTCEAQRPCGYGLSRTNPPGWPHRSTTCLVGPPPAPPRERRQSQPHPGRLPPPRPPVSRWRRLDPIDHSTASNIQRLFHQLRHPPLTGLARRWLGHSESWWM